jgi:hypothetical protein
MAVFLPLRPKYKALTLKAVIYSMLPVIFASVVNPGRQENRTIFPDPDS